MGFGSARGAKGSLGDSPGCPVDKVSCGAAQAPWTVVRNMRAPFPLGFLWHGPRGEGVGRELEASGKTDAQCPAHFGMGFASYIKGSGGNRRQRPSAPRACGSRSPLRRLMTRRCSKPKARSNGTESLHVKHQASLHSLLLDLIALIALFSFARSVSKRFPRITQRAQVWVSLRW